MINKNFVDESSFFMDDLASLFLLIDEYNVYVDCVESACYYKWMLTTYCRQTSRLEEHKIFETYTKTETCLKNNEHLRSTNA